MGLIIHVYKLNNNKSVEKGEIFFILITVEGDGEEQTADEGCHQLMEGVNKLTDGKKHTQGEKRMEKRKEVASRGWETGSGWRRKNKKKTTKKTARLNYRVRQTRWQVWVGGGRGGGGGGGGREREE